jgi:type 1 glutamine amidotransferase
MRIGFVSLCVMVLVGGLTDVASAQTHVPRVLYLSTVAAGAFAHPSRTHAGEVIAALGQSSGAFSVTLSEDVAQLSPANLATYDAVIFFTAGELPIGDIEKNALLQFVSGGKGFIGIHSATDTFYTWPAYGDMIGAYFENHPWDRAASIRVEDQNHRATRHLGAAFTITDELYQVRNWSRANVHVLLSLDLSSVPPGGSRPDNDYALAWTKSYGAGRVFYSALGHHPELWDDTRYQTYILNGIRWALGDPDLSLHHRYLAEGATGVFFDTRIALVNPDPAVTAHAQLRFLPESGSIVTTDVTLGPSSRQTVFVDDVPGMASAAFSTTIDSDQPVVVDRTMTWAFGQAYGSHAETSVAGPATTWYFAEGATHGRFDLFYLIQNPSPTQKAIVTASYLPPDGQAIEKTYEVEPNHRFTIEADKIPGLEAAEFAAAFTSSNGVPVIVERAMYLSTPDQVWAGGHDSAGATSLDTRWFLAEGATGGFFHTFVLAGNPNATDAELRFTYLRNDGATVVRNHTVLARGRLTINVATEDPALEQTEVSTIVESTNGVKVVVERAQWWPSTAAFWYEGHGSMGTTQPGTQWALADGEAGGPQNAKTYVLIATEDGPPTDSLKLTVFVEGGAPITRVYENRLTPNRRFTIDMDGDFPELTGHRFGVLVQSLGGMPLVVERAMYHDANGVFWAAGTNVVATRLQ